MRYILLIAWREYAENAKTRGFWLGLLIFPILIFASIRVPVLLQSKGVSVRHYVVIDQSGLFAPAIAASMTNDWARRQFQELKPPPEVKTNAAIAALAAQLRPYLRQWKRMSVGEQHLALNAAILIPRDIEKQIALPGETSPEGKSRNSGVQYWSANLADTTLRDTVERAINEEIHRRQYVARGMDAAIVRQVQQTRAPFVTLNPEKENGQEAVNKSDFILQWAPSAFVYLLWVSIFTINQMLLNNIIEEKSNRIIEVLLSSVTPSELMLGKLLGIAGIGLTMVSTWVLSLYVELSWNSGGGEIVHQALTVLHSTRLVPMFAVYFLLGYFMYSSFILALGSVCNTLKEAQSYMGFITMIMMVPLLTMTFIPKEPNGSIARLLSWIPIYTPFVMMNRVNAAPPAIDLIGTFFLLVASAAGGMWMAGKVFRIGILRTGQPPRIVEMLRWIKQRER